MDTSSVAATLHQPKSNIASMRDAQKKASRLRPAVGNSSIQFFPDTLVGIGDFFGENTQGGANVLRRIFRFSL